MVALGNKVSIGDGVKKTLKPLAANHTCLGRGEKKIETARITCRDHLGQWMAAERWHSLVLGVEWICIQ